MNAGKHEGRYPLTPQTPFTTDAATIKNWREALHRFEAWRRTSIGQEHSETEASFAEFVHFSAPVRPILDIGCGSGSYGDTVGHDGYLGIDPLVLKPAPCLLVQGVAEHLPFRNGSFATIVALGSLDHFADLNEAIDEILRVLRPDGRFVLWQHVVRSDPQFKLERIAAYLRRRDIRGLLRSVFGNIRMAAHAGARDGYGHLYDFSERSLLKIVSQKFSIENVAFRKQQMFIAAHPRSL